MAEDHSAQEAAGLKGLRDSFGGVNAVGYDNDAVSKVNEKARELSKTIHAKDEKVMSSESYENSGYIAGTVQAGTIFDQKNSKSADAEKALITQILMDRLQANLVYWEGVRADAEHEIQLAQARITEINTQIEAIDVFIDRMEDGNSVPLNENGEIDDPHVKQAILDYEARTGVKIDRSDVEALKNALLDQRSYVDGEERNVLEDSIDQNKKIVKAADRNIQTLEDKIVELEEHGLSSGDTKSAEQLFEDLHRDAQAIDSGAMLLSADQIDVPKSLDDEQRVSASSASDMFAQAAMPEDHSEDLFKDLEETDDLFAEVSSNDLFEELDSPTAPAAAIPKPA